VDRPQPDPTTPSPWSPVDSPAAMASTAPVVLRKQSSAVEVRDDSKPVAGRLRTAASSIPVLARKAPIQLQKTVADVVRLFAAIIQYLRVPLLIVLLAPVLPGLVLLLASVARGGSDVPLAFVLVGIALVPSAWLGVRRHQLLNALQPPAEAAAQMYAAVGSPEVWNQVKSNLGQLLERPKKLRLRSLSGKIWRGVKMGFDLRDSIAESPRFAPFLPSRLRGLAYLAGWCLLSFLVLALLAAAKLLASSLGLG
jgi:hypothetical protein